MAGRKNSVSGLFSRSGRGVTGGLELNSSLQATSLVSDSNRGTESSENLKTLSDAKNVSMGSRVNADNIQFGIPSSSKTTTSQTGNEWTNLLKQTASGGIASALGGGLDGIGGLGSLISGLVGLFGGSTKAPSPPLVRFQLPDSQNQTVYVSSTGSTVYQGSAVESPGGSRTTPIYANITAASSQSSMPQPLRYQGTEIAQAVKNAILNSSSLNDVIAEI